MPYAVTHVLLTIIILELFRDYFVKDKKKLPLHFVFLGGIAGLFPDIDVLLKWVLEPFGVIIIHGMITHTIFFALIFLVISLIYYGFNKKASTLFLIFFFGIMFHLALDYLLGGGFYEGSMLLYPLSFKMYKLHLLISTKIPNIMAGLDAAILLLWLYHEEKRHKIRSFF